MKRFAIAALVSAAAPALHAQSPTAERPCLIVFSQGRSASASDPKVNEMWNALNNAFNQFVSDELAGKGRRVVPLPHPVEARDMQANIARIMKRAHSDGCDTLVDVTMFADQRSQQFVSRMRVHPVLATKVGQPAAGIDYAVGPESFADQQTDPLTLETLDRLVPSEIAKRLVDAYIASTKKN